MNAQTRYGWDTAFSASDDHLAISDPKRGLVHVFDRNLTTSTWSLANTLTGFQELEQLGFCIALH